MSRTVLVGEQFKVSEFLGSVARNSEKTRALYTAALTHFQTFLSTNSNYSKYTAESILEPVLKNQINVYTLIDNFVSYLISREDNGTRIKKLSPKTVLSYVAPLRSYLLYHDIDIVESKFRRRVKLPKNYREDEEALDASDIRKILLSCNNRRLKAYLIVLASGGMRAMEALAVRNCDIDFSVKPTRIHIRAQFAKTRVSRDVYISEEATKFLKEWLDFKYREKGANTIEKLDDILVFGTQARSVKPQVLYGKLWQEFNKILETVDMGKRKEGMLRRRITLHSLRRHAKSVISTQVGQDYSEWFLGHSKSPYWTVKEQQRREIYKNNIMPFLTFLDYSALENTSKGIVSQLENKDKEIAYLRERDLKRELEMKEMNERITKLDSVINKIDKLEKELGIT